MTKYARLKEDMAGYDVKNGKPIKIPEGTIVDLGGFIQTAFIDGAIICYDPEKRTELFEILE